MSHARVAAYDAHAVLVGSVGGLAAAAHGMLRGKHLALVLAVIVIVCF